jgi:HD-like signal output (HDOD) protein/ActR/RegA family two-component response regulator
MSKQAMKEQRMTRILFVDDEPNIRDGMRRMLRSMRDEWDMEFADSGEMALRTIDEWHAAHKPFDVVVSDMRMPGMDGADLLARVKDKSPDTVRLILSGHSDTASIMKTVGNAHQYLNKPCDPELLKYTIKRAFALRMLLRDEHLQKVVGQIASLPSLPVVYQEVMSCLQQPNASLADVGKVIGKDVGMTATLLKLVSSAFFGLSKPVSSVERAVSFLGLDTLIALVLGQGLFKEAPPINIAGFSLEGLWQHSLQTAAAARVIAAHQGLDKSTLDDAFLAGMLHDIGKLVLAQSMPDLYAEVIRQTGSSFAAPVERQLMHTTHADIGAYLLGLWGLTNAVVEAVAFHENPADAPTQVLGLPAIVHAADRLVRYPDQQDPAHEQLQLDVRGLDTLGIRDCWPKWQAAWSAHLAGEAK